MLKYLCFFLLSCVAISDAAEPTWVPVATELLQGEKRGLADYAEC